MTNITPFLIDKNDDKQVDAVIAYLASIRFNGELCVICKRPILFDGHLLDGAICVENNKIDPITWAHRSCYCRNN